MADENDDYYDVYVWLGGGAAKEGKEEGKKGERDEEEGVKVEILE